MLTWLISTNINSADLQSQEVDVSYAMATSSTPAMHGVVQNVYYIKPHAGTCHRINTWLTWSKTLALV